MNIETKQKVGRIVLAAALISSPCQALEIVIQNQTLSPATAVDTCINIAGEYEGFRVEDSVAGKQARICQQSKASNLLVISDANFVATRDGMQITVQFRHDFAPGLNGPVIGRVSADGFFATGTGTEAPSGDRIELKGYLRQGSQDDLIDAGVGHTVGASNDFQSAVFDLKTEKQYLVAGARSLKGELIIALGKTGHQMALLGGIRVSLDPIYTKDRFAD